jgi:hypothetical protein
VLRVYAQTRFLLIMNIVRIAIVAVFIGWFLSAFGLYGAVGITLLSMCVVKVIGLVRIATLLHVSFADSLPWKRLGLIAAASIVSAGPAFWLVRHVQMRPFVGMVAATAVYCAVYFALCIAYFRMGYATLKESQPCAA